MAVNMFEMSLRCWLETMVMKGHDSSCGGSLAAVFTPTTLKKELHSADNENIDGVHSFTEWEGVGVRLELGLQSTLSILYTAAVCMLRWVSVCAWEARNCMERASGHTEYRQSLYLPLCSARMPCSRRLFQGPPYLSHAPPLLLPLPPDRTLLLGSLGGKHKRGHS